ncbi:MAG: hypothetical protein HC896_07020 [Bacteroidales bacterium]|nr:hypothetical protein [Bacteroidales bacterium]
MEDFVKRMLDGSGINPPEACLQAFAANFEGAVNIEWWDRGSSFEAIFYRDNLEHIAIFDRTGLLIEYRQFLPAPYLPEAIKTDLEARGEIMNAVLRNKGNSIEYEAIIRDKDLNRFLILMTDLGKVTEERKL